MVDDEPGVGGFQPSIFKRFYWWEDECADRMQAAFGLAIVRKSYAELGARAKEMILSGRLYAAEELPEMGLIDLLAPPGEGEAALRRRDRQAAAQASAH